MVLHDEMLECTVFNDWFYGTSYDSLRSDCINIGVFSPVAVEALIARPDVDVQIVRLRAGAKTRLLRQLNREDSPNVDEIVRRYSADKIDFDGVDEDFNCIVEWNGDGIDLTRLADTILLRLGMWVFRGQNRLSDFS
jgi:hypothetical protein